MSARRPVLAGAIGGVVAAARLVVAEHEELCRSVIATTGKKERARAEAAYGPDLAWLWCADPAMLALRERLAELERVVG